METWRSQKMRENLINELVQSCVRHDKSDSIGLEEVLASHERKLDEWAVYIFQADMKRLRSAYPGPGEVGLSFESWAKPLCFEAGRIVRRRYRIASEKLTAIRHFLTSGKWEKRNRRAG